MNHAVMAKTFLDAAHDVLTDSVLKERMDRRHAQSAKVAHEGSVEYMERFALNLEQFRKEKPEHLFQMQPTQELTCYYYFTEYEAVLAAHKYRSSSWDPVKTIKCIKVEDHIDDARVIIALLKY